MVEDNFKIATGYVDDIAGFDKPKSWQPLPPTPPLTPEEQAAYEETQRENERYREEYRQRQADEKAARRALEAYLRYHGIEIEIWGCGCCDAPVVKYRVNDKVIEVLNANISTLPGAKDEDDD